ncbi:DUF2267 domain-containing protein [Alteraurantiacibacter aquimixticola]|uniref:DUF2267 domain-containing protein n=1 Tax=Alteraurantiacibacter aquimixticola TaxID=2489173 RepID=A0A4T3F0M3_9SPHN|nr:DUF2267 domain-containing protein [Alteraurantiacibacter aquimixticola]TIX50589.1 DUF2267 domain-containing protein [Alteraurantiacibacter aquimixticola]
MSTTGLEVFDKTLHTTHVWLDEINGKIGPDRAVAWKVLSVVLHTLRDRLPLQVAAHLGAQLPLLVRGIYYYQFEPEKLPGDMQQPEEFIHAVQAGLQNTRTVDAKDAIAAVFGVLSNHVSDGQVEKVRHALPKSLRALWPEEIGA